MIMSKRTITRKQREVFSYIKQYITEHKRGPLIREICEHFNFSSTATGHKYLSALNQAGVIVRNGQRGGITLAELEESMSIPLLGTIDSEGIIWTERAHKFF